MALELFGISVLNKVVDKTEAAISPILDMFFGLVEVSITEKIYFDSKALKRRLSPFVAPYLQGRIVKKEGYTTESFSPAYIKDKRVFEPSTSLKRRVGESFSGDLTPSQRLQMNVADEIVDMQEMLTRRLETMAVEALRTGKITVTGDGFDTVVVDFNRNGDHTVTLTGAARWGQTDVSPLADVKGWSSTVLKNSGKGVTDIIMDTLAWEFFEADTAVDKILDIRRGAPAQLDLGALAELGMQFKGTIGLTRYWVYENWYEDGDTGTVTAVMPANTVILASQGVSGVRHFGAIKDIKAQSTDGVSGMQPDGLLARELFVKSWDEEDPSVRYIMGQSAPMTVPYFTDATLAATVA